MPVRFMRIRSGALIDTVVGVGEHLTELDESISKYSTNWTTNRLSRITVAILRLALYEMKYTADVPVNAAINEAVELAKKYDFQGVVGIYQRCARCGQPRDGERLMGYYFGELIRRIIAPLRRCTIRRTKHGRAEGVCWKCPRDESGFAQSDALFQHTLHLTERIADLPQGFLRRVDAAAVKTPARERWKEYVYAVLFVRSGNGTFHGTRGRNSVL